MFLNIELKERKLSKSFAISTFKCIFSEKGSEPLHHPKAFSYFRIIHKVQAYSRSIKHTKNVQCINTTFAMSSMPESKRRLLIDDFRFSSQSLFPVKHPIWDSIERAVQVCFMVDQSCNYTMQSLATNLLGCWELWARERKDIIRKTWGLLAKVSWFSVFFSLSLSRLEQSLDFVQSINRSAYESCSET